MVIELRDLFTDELVRTFKPEKYDDIRIRDNVVEYCVDYNPRRIKYSFPIPPGYYAFKVEANDK